jgi:hypothetical protein
MNSLDAINNEMVDFRRDFYHKIVKNNSSQKVFINGWLNRAEKFRI